MNVASPGHELNPGHLVYQKDVSNPPSKSRLEGDEAKDGGGLWSIRGSTSASLSAGNQTTISDGVSLREVMSQYCQAGINTEWTDVLLIISGFVSGLVDGLSFNSWGSFSSMQTGNTVFIALGVSGQPTNPPYLWAKSLISLVVFLTSNQIFIYASRALHPLRRSTLVLSFGIQTAAILAAALLVQLGAVDSKPEDPRAPIQWMQCLPIALLAFQAAGQIVASRVLAYDEIPTVVLTALFCDLLVDPKLFDRPWKANPKRNRRIAAFLALFLGAMTAGGLSKETTMTASLWLAMGLKLVITLSFFLWKDDRSVTPKRRDEESG